MQLANFEQDYWQLRNGEESHKTNPDTFWIPPIEERKSLKVGDAAKIILEIECENEEGEIIIECERGYVIVSEIIGDKYIGILVSSLFALKRNENTSISALAQKFLFHTSMSSI
ncbi:hypothetical protein [Stutzerimonas stutzeri]|jgi:hypothetical protein|uniref:Uncharacterized protein n=1 Tax=Stutzerimonas stutzeri TaxID=316 RepID=A0A5S5B8M5_STUST|nr:hypothetical protein [Stutzerimonas stutzeri]TYP63385.1 hypothetical protein A9A72_123153 [Stutzerimonas stutzeri]